ncbi:hypothetical protein AB0I34_33825 [Kribbella sp. NPDC050281]|uniref:hypothetical protein n=1 Tax=Kribbella sp. NPDC050281 TaxID=3155515 RepID=UPI0033FF43AD
MPLQRSRSTPSPAGKLVANGNSQGTTPARLKPGQVALAFIYFEMGGNPPPRNAKSIFTAQRAAPGTESFDSADIKVTEAERSGQRLVGTAENTNSKELEGPYGELLSEHGTYAAPDGPLAANGSVSYSIDLYGQPCPTFLVGSTAYFK